MKLRTLATIAMLFACVASAALAGEGLLRRAWMERMPDRAALLREAQRRFNALVPEWDAAEPERVRTGAWWFVDHRDVSYLVLDQELAALPKGPRRSLALYLTGRLAARPLGSYLPALYSASRTEQERIEVLTCMGRIQDEWSVRTLQGLVTAPRPAVSEDVRIAAARGLGASRRAEFLPPLHASRALMQTLNGRFAVARACVECGDESALGEVASFAHMPRATASIQMEVVQFLQLHFCEDALRHLGIIARSSPHDEVAAAAVDAIVRATRYGLPPGRRPDEPAGEAPPAQRGPAPARPAAADLSAEETDELLDRVFEWWETEGRARFVEEMNAESYS